jgi:DNA (cytosine-5)-methyltransferase 1
MLKVLELFAGVGGFRIGLENTKGFQVVWSNQYEPLTPKSQHASWVYEKVFPKGEHRSEDLHNVPTNEIPEGDVLVGGFPCQDYSVATTLKNSRGLEGKKGVLFWQIERILREANNPPKYLILENVDRLIKSPAKQRGRDFAVMLKSFQELGYAIEWRVINAAEYGFAQRRRRVFIIGYHKSTNQFSQIKSSHLDWMDSSGVLASAFPINELNSEVVNTVDIAGASLLDISNDFGKKLKVSPFENSGLMVEGAVLTAKSYPKYNGEQVRLGDILIPGRVEDEFYIEKSSLPKWKYLKGAKKEYRKSGSGYEYWFSEGGMVFPDSLDKASRTIITGEGGASPSRFKHVVETPEGLRRLTPIELERLNGFPDNHTKHDKISNNKRAFFMGNALVCGVVESIGTALLNSIESLNGK